MHLEPFAAQRAQKRFGKIERAELPVQMKRTRNGACVMVIVVSCFGESCDGWAEIRAATAAIAPQKAERAAQASHVGAISQRRADTFLRHQPDLHQVGQVVGQGARLEVERLCDVTGRQPVGIAPHQQAKDRKPLRMAKGGQTSGNHFFHIS
jgi:hypothetical protein